MFEDFEIDEYVLDSHIVDGLKRLWNTGYPELYDDKYYFKNEKINNNNLHADLRGFLFRFFGDCQDEVSFKRYVFLGWSLCLAVMPTIDGFGVELDVFEDILSGLDSVSKSTKPVKWSIDDSTIPGGALEAVSVFEDMLHILGGDQCIDAFLNMVDSVVEGSAISPTSYEKRIIFNWVIIRSIPSAYSLELPKVIYSRKMELYDEWKYNRLS